MKNKSEVYSYFINVLILIGLLFCSFSKSFADQKYKDLQLFAKTLNLVQKYYVKDMKTKKLVYGGIKGMLKELDPHTSFLDPEIYKEFENESQGHFGGIGIELSIKSGVLTIISPIEDGPAWKAGLKSGDKIISINSESTKDFSLYDAARSIKGELGKKITLGIMRKSLVRPKIYSVKREIIKINPVKSTDLGEGYLYIRVTSFIKNTVRNFKNTIKKHKEKRGNVKGLILDLRQNPGGLLNQAIELSDLFLDKGIIVSTRGRDSKKEDIVRARSQGTLARFPTIVLIDEYSASASEIVAGALKDNRRALIMGQRSFGKGSVQSIIKLVDGSALKLTVAKYYTPKGISIQAEGVKPDIVLQNISPQDLGKLSRKRKIIREENIKGHLKSKKEESLLRSVSTSESYWWIQEKPKSSKKLSLKEKLLKKDFQVLQAYNYLKAWKIIKN